METPHFDHLCQERYSSVYEPAEDSFLLLDALEQDLGVINSTMPLICLEVGCGSGVVISALGRCLETPALCLGVDINPVACHCTQITAQKNGSNVDVICADLAIPLLGRLESSIDVLIFNPPYVVTESTEVLEPGLPRSWAGGKMGREVIDRFLPCVPKFLSPTGFCYLVAIKENDPDGIIRYCKSMGLSGKVIMRRRCGREDLFVIRIMFPGIKK